MRPIAFVLVAAASMASIAGYTAHASKQTSRNQHGCSQEIGPFER